MPYFDFISEIHRDFQRTVAHIKVIFMVHFAEQIASPKISIPKYWGFDFLIVPLLLQETEPIIQLFHENLLWTGCTVADFCKVWLLLLERPSLGTTKCLASLGTWSKESPLINNSRKVLGQLYSRSQEERDYLVVDTITLSWRFSSRMLLHIPFLFYLMREILWALHSLWYFYGTTHGDMYFRS